MFIAVMHIDIKFMSGKRLQRLVLALVLAVLLAIIYWVWQASWHTIPNTLLVNGKPDSAGRVYISPRKDEILIFLGEDDGFYYVYNQSKHLLGLCYKSDFTIITKFMALPKEQPPPRDSMPNEALSFPDPHLRTSKNRLEFTSFRHLHTVIEFNTTLLR